MPGDASIGPVDATEHKALPIMVALAVVLAGMVAIAFLGPGEQIGLHPPERIAGLQRTPSEEVSTPEEMLATYMAGTQVVVIGASRTSSTSTPTRDGAKYDCVS